jgi:hypothetical protein
MDTNWLLAGILAPVKYRFVMRYTIPDDVNIVNGLINPSTGRVLWICGM